MAYDFPAVPTDGQTFSPAGGPDYIYSSSVGAWLIKTSGSNSAFVAKAGDTMSGLLTLSGNPSTSLQAVPKQYADLGVRADATQAFSLNQKATARSNIYAAPFDALAFNGMQVNGSFEVSGERGTAGTNVSGLYVCDCWTFGNGSAAVVTGSMAFAGVGLFPGFQNCFYQSVQTAQPAALTGNQFVTVSQSIEGYRTNRLALGSGGAQSTTVSFWCAHSRAGIYSISLRNTSATRSCVASYTQNVAGASEYKTVSFPACTDGVWEYGTNMGVLLMFTFAAGPALVAPATGVWYPANYIAAPGQVNAVASTSDIHRITGVIFLPGNEAPTQERAPYISRPIDLELSLTKRYWEEVEVYLLAYGAAGSGQGGVSLPFMQTKRVVPTLSMVSDGSYNSTLNSMTATQFKATMVRDIGSSGTFSISCTIRASARF